MRPISEFIIRVRVITLLKTRWSCYKLKTQKDSKQ